jgi:hypothetical protein
MDGGRSTIRQKISFETLKYLFGESRFFPPLAPTRKCHSEFINRQRISRYVEELSQG